MKRHFCEKLTLVFLTILFTGSIVQAQPAQKKKSIAILDFEDKTNSIEAQKHQIGKLFADLFSNDFIEANNFTVVERSKITEIIKEQNFTAENQFNRAFAAKIGKLIGAEIVVLGTISEYTSARERVSAILGEKETFTTKIGASITIIDVKSNTILDSIAVEGTSIKRLNRIGFSTPELPDAEKIGLISKAINDATNKAIEQSPLLTIHNSRHNSNVPPTERFPAIEAPDKVNEKQEFSVLVSLTKDKLNERTQIKQGSKTSEGALALPLPDKKSFEIDVILTSEDFEISQNTSKVTMNDAEDSTPASFKLISKEIKEEKREGKIYASFFYEGRFLAKVFRSITIVGDLKSKQSQMSPGDISANIGNSETSFDRNKKENKSIALYKSTPFSIPNGESPDLTITVRENKDNAGKSELVISSKYLSPSTKIYYFNRPQELYQVLQSQYQRFSGMSFRGSEVIRFGEDSNKTAKDELKGFGKQIWEKHILPEVRDAFWELKDKLGAKFNSIQIVTNNPEFPWELAIPFREEGGKFEQLDFLGIDFIIARIHDNGKQIFAQEQQLDIKNRLIVAPNYSGNLKLPAQIEEKNELKKQGFQIWSGNIAGLRNLLANLPPGIIHFAGHGEVKIDENDIPQYAIVLEDGKFVINAWRGVIERNRTNRSFFFFNACEAGQSKLIANMAEGWAVALLETGAIGYVGGLWSIGDVSAKKFSLLFYQFLDEELKAGRNPLVADILRKTRKHFLLDEKNNDPTFLAYIFYGDANLRVYEE